MPADHEGKPVSEAQVADVLGFASVEHFRAWQLAGSPIGRCSNDACWLPASWPDLEKPCPWCGAPIKIDVEQK